MRIAALLTWILAAMLGGFLLATWLVKDGLRRRGERQTRFAPQLILGHAGLAATGLAIWVTYLVVATTALAWVALADLAVVAVLGATMFGLWLKTARQSHGRHASVPRHAAEDHFPPPAVLAHGLFAVTTVVLVLVTAVQAGGRGRSSGEAPAVGGHHTQPAVAVAVEGHLHPAPAVRLEGIGVL